MSRVVVVGGGFGGTAAAARLAKQGHDVTVVERLDRLGGAVGFVEQDGYRWDAGPTSTALPAVVRDLFRKSGRPLERELELVPVEPMREHRFEDGTVLAMPSGSRSAQLEAVDEALGAGLGQQWVDHVHGFAETWDVLRRAYLERPYSPDHVDKTTKARLMTRATLHKTVTKTFKDERLRAVALLPSLMDGHDPRNVPAWMGMWSYVEQNFGVWTVPGGMGLLAEAMTKRLGERKVQVLLGTTAVDLRLQDGRVVAVDTDHGPVDADVVVCAIDPRGLPSLASHVARTMPAIPPVICHLGLSGDVPDLPARGGAARRPDPRAAHERHGSRGRCGLDRAGTRTAVRGHHGGAGPARDRRAPADRGARRPLAARPGGGARGIRLRHALAGPGDDRTQAAGHAVRRGVRRRRARRGRGGTAVRGAVGGRRGGADRHRPEVSGQPTEERRPA